MSVSRQDWWYKEMDERMDENLLMPKTERLLKPRVSICRSPSQEDILFDSIIDILYDNSMRIPEGDYVNIMNNLKKLKDTKKRS